MTAIIACLGADCPERFSLCCHARSKAKGRGFICSKCGKKFEGGECRWARNMKVGYYYEKVADRIFPKFSEICKRGKCKHPKCECGHCQRNYHIGKAGECTQINQDLTTCRCKRFKASQQEKEVIENKI